MVRAIESAQKRHAPVSAVSSTAAIALAPGGAMLAGMKRLAIRRPLFSLILLMAGMMMVGVPASAGDIALTTYARRAPALPFPRSERAEAVWASGACWTDCGSHCAWGIAACLTHDAQGHCLKLGDACDRYCQRQCRTQGGPLVSDLFDAWE
jgi:hypothetical protein